MFDHPHWCRFCRKQFLQLSTSVKAEDTTGNSASGPGNPHSTNQMRSEQRITFTICAIVTCFTLTQVRFLSLAFCVFRNAFVSYLFTSQQFFRLPPPFCSWSAEILPWDSR